MQDQEVSFSKFSEQMISYKEKNPLIYVSDYLQPIFHHLRTPGIVQIIG